MAQVPANAIVGLSYAHIAGAATTVVKPVPGALMKLLMNSASVGTITIYDGVSTAGAVIGVITVGTAIVVPTPWFTGFDTAITCKAGITIVTSAACDLTVFFR